MINPNLLEILEEILLLNTQGVSELDLLKKLMEINFFSKDALGNQFSMFQTHFFLFHHLYTLRNNLRISKKYDIQINCLNIKLFPIDYNESENLPQIKDQLEIYYLDKSNIHLSELEVSNMINDFWKKYSQYQPRQDALNILGLKDPISDSEILKKFRELILLNHPDSGGSGEEITKIINAKKTLLG
jgi:hypothetical protein